MRLNGVQRLLETGLIVSTFAAVFILCALISFHPADPAWSQTGEFTNVQNITGTAGAWVADILLLTFGWLAYFVPAAIQLLGYLVFKQPHRILQLDYTTLGLRIIGFALFITSATAISSINFDDIYNFSSGGVVGDVIASAMMPAFNFTGTSILLLCFFFAGLTLLTGVSWVQFVDYLGDLIVRLYRFLVTYARGWMQRERIAGKVQDEQPDAYFEDDTRQQESELANKTADKPKALDKPAAKVNAPQDDEFMPFDELDQILDQEISFSAIDDEPMDTEAALNALDQSPVVEPEKPATTVVSPARPINKPKQGFQPPPTAKEKFEQLLEQEPPPGPLPSLDLLDRPDKAKNPISQEELDSVSRLVETKLLDFNVQATVVGVYPGPVVTRFELDLAPGIKVSKITGLSKDLARSLSAISVRVVEVIPGKTYIGIELPNKYREIVRLSEVINAPKFEQNPSPLTMVLGKDIAGQPVCADLGKMPHLLVAGTTGSGKSVGVNVMILSLLYKSGPEDVRMIMIDPKMLELSVYEGIPHLLAPVVTDMRQAGHALNWCVAEMERRYKLMSTFGVRNLAGFNQKLKESIEQGNPLTNPFSLSPENPEPLEDLPQIVIVIDELADLMMVMGKKIEELIARLAQKARASGIHLVLATQRPSVDVITGLIKANIPARVAFQVSSKIDSRTILDQMGAETLLGKGDMLYMPPGTGYPVRIHGAFVSDQEVHKVVNFLKTKGEPIYRDEILNPNEGDASFSGDESSSAGEKDPLYDEAVAIVLKTRKASISYVQRHLRIGYNRAARIIEDMEKAGIVTPMQSNGNREIVVPNNND